MVALHPLPRLPARKVGALTHWLRDRYDAQRPPEAAAKLLTLVGLLYWQGEGPEPLLMYGKRTRQDVAKHLGISVAALDANLSLYQGRGLIRRRIEVIPGNIEQSPERVVQCDYVDPVGDFVGVSILGPGW